MGLWATQKHNEDVLDRAFRTSKDVYLIFSVNRSGEFYGYARMAGRCADGPAWTDGGQDSGLGQTFKVKWLCTQGLPFQRTRHIRNAWNHDREVKVSRDGTELEPSVGFALLEEWRRFLAGAACGWSLQWVAALADALPI
ncbi:YTH domain-containing protein [Mycena olivaceomarginata]|nr:YTH domain-containing protein [Mycena olivaceomarginata]